MYKRYINLITKIINNIKFIPTKYHKMIKRFFMILYYTITKLLVILLINYYLKSVKEAVAITIIFMLIRGFAQGIHAKKNWICWIITLLVFGITPQLIKYYDINNYLVIFLYPVFIMNFLLLAPNDTVKNPLKNTCTRIILKLVGCLIVINYYIYSINHFNIISDAMFYATLITLVSFHPLTYKLFKQPSYNYRYL